MERKIIGYNITILVSEDPVKWEHAHCPLFEDAVSAALTKAHERYAGHRLWFTKIGASQWQIQTDKSDDGKTSSNRAAPALIEAVYD